MDITPISDAARRLMQCRPKCRTLDEFMLLARQILQVQAAADQSALACQLGVLEAPVKGLVMVCAWAIEFVEHVHASGRRVSLAAVQEVWPIKKEDMKASQWSSAPTRAYRLGMGAVFLRDSVRLPDV